MKPLIKYRGGKSKEIKYIEKYIPKYTGRYIEPFFGGGALFFYLSPKKAIINDINSKLIDFYVGIKENYLELKQELDSIEAIYNINRIDFEHLKSRNVGVRVPDNNEQLYYKLRDMYNGYIPKEYSDALLYFFINKTSYSGMIRYNSRGDFNVPYGRYKNFNTKLVTSEHHDLLSNTEILNIDYSEVFNMSSQEDFIFLDPPYDCVFSDYGNEEYKGGFNEDAHRKLSNDIRNLSCKSLLVIGKTPLTEELYKGFIIAEYDKTYSVNIRNRFQSIAKHILVANYK